MQLFLFNAFVTHTSLFMTLQWEEAEELALASWVVRHTALAAVTLPPTARHSREDGPPHPEALCRRGAGAEACRDRAACPRGCRY